MAALVERDDAVVQGLLDKLRNPATSLPAKYRILFSLRGIAGPAAHAAMLEGARLDGGFMVRRAFFLAPCYGVVEAAALGRLS